MSYRCVVPSLSSSIIITESATIKGLGTRCSKRKNASAVLTGRCDVVSDWAACSAITTATPHRSSGGPAGRNGWSAGEVCSGSPIAEPVPRRLVSASFENASRIRHRWRDSTKTVSWKTRGGSRHGNHCNASYLPTSFWFPVRQIQYLGGRTLERPEVSANHEPTEDRIRPTH